MPVPAYATDFKRLTSGVTAQADFLTDKPKLGAVSVQGHWFWLGGGAVVRK